MIIRFIHAADLHLGCSLRGLLEADDGREFPHLLSERIRDASTRAFEQLVRATIAREAKFVVLAGDVWEHEHIQLVAFTKQMGLLAQNGIQVYMILGNHDANAEVQGLLSNYWNVHVFPCQQARTELAKGCGWQVALHGQSFATQHVTDNLVKRYPEPLAGLFNVGLLHTSLESDGAPYAPCRLVDLQAKGYDYWALGHVHDYRQCQSPGAEETIVFPGILQGRHIRETGAKGAILVSVDTDSCRIVELERLIVDVVRWHKLEITTAGTPDEIADLISRKLGQEVTKLHNETKQLQSQLPERQVPILAVRIAVAIAAGNIARNARDIRQRINELISYTYPSGEVVVEGVEVSHSWDRYEREPSLNGIQRLIGKACRDRSLITEQAEHLSDVLSALPQELRQYMGFEPWPGEAPSTQRCRLVDGLRLISPFAPQVLDGEWLPELMVSLGAELMDELEEE